MVLDFSAPTPSILKFPLFYLAHKFMKSLSYKSWGVYLDRCGETKSPSAIYAEGRNANSGIELIVELARVELASR